MADQEIWTPPRHTTGTARGERRYGENTGKKPARKGRTANDATGINPGKRKPIDPRMPDLPPA